MRSNTITFMQRLAGRIHSDPRSALEQELAAFDTDADRLELETLLEAYPVDQTRDVREILARQAA